MSVLVIFNSSEITQQHYEQLRKDIRWETQHPSGILLHAAAVNEAGHLTVVDVWESAEQMKAFVDSRLGPALQARRLPPPNVQVMPTINVNAYPAIAKVLLR